MHILITGANSRRINKSMPQDDPSRRCPDITRAKALLGWEPKVLRSEGLQRTIENFRARLDI